MGFLSKLFGSKPAPSPADQLRIAAPTVGKPTEAVLIPGKYFVRAHAHSLGESKETFVTLVSHGLTAVRQREILFTLLTRPGDPIEDHLKELTLFLAQVGSWAFEGKLVDAGGFTQFGQRGLLGQSKNGIMYVDAEPLHGVDVPPRALAALIVDSNEIALATTGLSARVLARRGEDHRHYPFPLWNDLRRTATVTADAEQSVLAKAPRGRVPGISTLFEANRLRVTVNLEGRAALREAFGQKLLAPPFAFLTTPAPTANARFVWRPGQTQPAAITPPGSDGSRLTGVFWLVSGESDHDEVRLIEDGHALLLTTSSLESLWKALEQQQPFALPQARGMAFSLEWTS